MERSVFPARANTGDPDGPVEACPLMVRTRADIHDGREHMLQSEAGYIDARPHRQDRGNLLHRTAGPYKRVNSPDPTYSAGL